jgi:hypothetical protein
VSSYEWRRVFRELPCKVAKRSALLRSSELSPGWAISTGKGTVMLSSYGEAGSMIAFADWIRIYAAKTANESSRISHHSRM